MKAIWMFHSHDISSLIAILPAGLWNPQHFIPCDCCKLCLKCRLNESQNCEVGEGSRTQASFPSPTIVPNKLQQLVCELPFWSLPIWSVPSWVFLTKFGGTFVIITKGGKNTNAFSLDCRIGSSCLLQNVIFHCGSMHFTVTPKSSFSGFVCPFNLL